VNSRVFSAVADKAVIEWLLEESNPCIRCLTLARLLGYSPECKEVRKAEREILQYEPVKKILSKQRRNGGWDSSRTWYLPKYKSTIWQLLILSQTGINPGLPIVKRMCEHAFRFQTPYGAFHSGIDRDAESDWGRLAGCLNGNVVASLCQLGRAHDLRVRKAVDHLVSIQESDGGWGCRSFGYHRRDRHSCFMGTICALEGFLEFQERDGSNRLNQPISDACEFLLMHRLYRADHHRWQVIRSDFPKLRAPWLVNYNILRALCAITRAGITEDSRMHDALSVLVRKRKANGRWNLEAPWPSTAYLSFGRTGTESKWVTLKAMSILRRLPATGMVD